ncbi:hypothetical protein P261_02297 [Lachnospiraceae bacterium TWA4]|nr:hypothetical protein P261_02297 [Lachnospiraceae bacterium TWA4]
MLFLLQERGGLMGLDYFYGRESEQFAFLRVPKILFTDVRYVDLSSDAKMLFGLMIDRLGLSRKNGWIDEQDRVYIRYTNKKYAKIWDVQVRKRVNYWTSWNLRLV